MSSIIREMQIKTTIRYHLTSVRMPIINKQQVLARMWRKENPSALLGRVQIGAANVESSMELPQKIKDGALTSVVQLVGHHPTERKVASSIASQGTRLGCGPVPSWRCAEATDQCSLTHKCFSPSFFLLSLSPKINK